LTFEDYGLANITQSVFQIRQGRIHITQIDVISHSGKHIPTELQRLPHLIIAVQMKK